MQPTMEITKFEHHNKRIRTKHVTFSQTSTLIVTCPKTRPELKILWYTLEDIRRFKQETLNSAHFLLERHACTAKAYIQKSLQVDRCNVIGQFGGIEHVCGIEHLLSPQVFHMIMATRVLTIERVLREQECQRGAGTNHYERIAQASMMTSTFAREWHHSKAVLNGAN